MDHRRLIFGLLIPLMLGSAQTVSRAQAAQSPDAPLMYEEPKFLAGAIYSSDPDKAQLLFNFKRVATRSGSTLKVERDYTYPDGRLAARERVVYEGNALLSYDLEELQVGAVGFAKIQHPVGNDAKVGGIDFEYRKEPGSRPKSRFESLVDNTLINDMVGPFLVAHWEAFARAEKVKCRYVVVPRRETVGFSFSKTSDSVWQGHEVLIVKMEATSPFVATLVDPLFFTIEKAPPHRVFQYAGRTTPKINVRGKWKDLDAVTVFDWATSRR